MRLNRKRRIKTQMRRLSVVMSGAFKFLNKPGRIWLRVHRCDARALTSALRTGCDAVAET
jgi:hypothetical protein